MSSWLTNLRRNSDLPPVQKLFQQMMDDFWDTRPMLGLTQMDKPLAGFQPRVNIKESENQVTVTAELPGMDEKDFEVSIDRSSLVLKGEKKYEEEKTQKGVTYFESTYGSFMRRIPLPFEVNLEKVEAGFKKGILTVNMEKADIAKAQSRRINVQTHA